MRRITEHVFAEIYFWGCNPGVLTTSDGVFMIDTPQQPIDVVTPETETTALVAESPDNSTLDFPWPPPREEDIAVPEVAPVAWVEEDTQAAAVPAVSLEEPAPAVAAEDEFGQWRTPLPEELPTRDVEPDVVAEPVPAVVGRVLETARGRAERPPSMRWRGADGIPALPTADVTGVAVSGSGSATKAIDRGSVSVWRPDSFRVRCAGP
jgi:hypothetical protein